MTEFVEKIAMVVKRHVSIFILCGRA